MHRTEKELAEEAMAAQDACNLIGVVTSFKLALVDLWMIARERGEGTDWVGSHPVSVAYGSKIEQLTNCSDFAVVDSALERMEKMINPTTINVMEDSCDHVSESDGLQPEQQADP